MLVLAILPEDDSANVETRGAFVTTLNVNLKQKYAKETVRFYIEFEFVAKSVAVAREMSSWEGERVWGRYVKEEATCQGLFFAKYQEGEGRERERDNDREGEVFSSLHANLMGFKLTRCSITELLQAI